MQPSRRQEHWRDLAAMLRKEIAAIRTPSGAKPAAASRALRTLIQLESEIEQRLDQELDARRRRVVGPRTPERLTIYSIDSSPRGDALTEEREGVARPMKVPVPHYQAVAEVVAHLDEPTRFGPIHGQVERTFGDRVAPYAVRVPLRFWAAIGLVSHAQARFSPLHPPRKFRTEARDAWRAVRSDPLRVAPRPIGQS